ncbi:DUF1428 domain-containing protein [Tepidamorphus sp. 3E244]|uniref:DUF1428 domain-containing protein n=1 Tax=Tepidamorphus sp. 3E244 TaxID=3385498 RepID=UPI0038FCDA6B
MSYVDGFLVAVKTDKKDVYIDMAEKAAASFRKNGATEVIECWAEDVPDGKVTSFPMAVKKEADETVVFSWIRWPSRKVRDEGMAAAMEEMKPMFDPDTVPFDGMRMIFGGFDVIVEK